MTEETEKPTKTDQNMSIADGISNVSAALRGVSEALSYRAEVEDDDMLALLVSVIDEQADMLRNLAKRMA